MRKCMLNEDRDAPHQPCTNTEPVDSSMSDVSLQDSQQHRRAKLKRGQCTKLLQKKRRKAQMRLVSIKRGAIVNTRVGEPLCLEMFVADLSAALARIRDSDGRFVQHASTSNSEPSHPLVNVSS